MGFNLGCVRGIKNVILQDKYGLYKNINTTGEDSLTIKTSDDSLCSEFQRKGGEKWETVSVNLPD